VSDDKRYEALKILLQTITPYLGIIFVSKLETLEFVERLLKRDQIPVEVISSTNGARERGQSIKRIQRLEVTWVLSSDVLARGIDLDLSHVIHFDLPRPLSLFMHRSGRTGRMKKSGEVITLYTSKDKQEMDKLMTQGINFKKATLKPTGMELRPKRKPKVAQAKAVRKDERVKPNYKKKRLLQRSIQK
jgi:ATP-dependent RNA helicase CshB